MRTKKSSKGPVLKATAYPTGHKSVGRTSTRVLSKSSFNVSRQMSPAPQQADPVQKPEYYQNYKAPPVDKLDLNKFLERHLIQPKSSMMETTAPAADLRKVRRSPPIQTQVIQTKVVSTSALKVRKSPKNSQAANDSRLSYQAKPVKATA